MNDEYTPLLARQPILDRAMKVVGYELLCRPIPNASQEWQDNFGDRATSEVIIGAYNELGIEVVTGGLPAYINFTRYWIANPPLLGPSPIVAEILEHIDIDEELIKLVKRLRKLKYMVALDDYTGQPLPEKLLQHLDIIKVDMLAIDGAEQLREIIQQYQRPGLRWLAEKVETMADFEACLAAGCDLFQGYFYSKPNILYGRRIPDNKIAVLRLLKVLNNPDADIDEATRILQSDPQLSFKLLQMVNSAYVGCANEVSSIPRAIMIVGFDRIRSWSNIIALGRLDDKPGILREQAVMRACLARELAPVWKKILPEDAFTMGLFSLLDAFVDIPIGHLCNKMYLASDLTAALTTGSGEMGGLLQAVLSMERGDWLQLDWQSITSKGIDVESLGKCYQRALKEARELLSVLQ
ncbi:EAL and HDOD domain-containing protein [Parathalassolituus penaei]|uniref:HDOD domain-containing protein n=1 Tax=Parathalassolituus penaei TaxID=2997323 RepID=A0A9X3EFF1_9GAMM|nr:HDOD domain-containing protein [Parathalassolituus penaei]MCY0966572.1 HDOD domain-containing protein [Parathalassolituus penaei]